jgi:short-subunit dehydrogenase
MDDSLKDKVVVITGASSGIGLETSILLLKKGVRCYMLGRDFTTLKTRIGAYKFDQGQLHFISVDLNNDLDIEHVVKKLSKENTIDILIHSAGIIYLGSVEKTGIEKLDEQYRINLRAPYLMTQKLLPKIIKSAGLIVFINSTAGLSSWENHSQYSATKFGLKAFAESLRKEMKPFGVRVVNIFPGATATPMQEFVQQLEGNKYNEDDFLSAFEVAQSIVCSLTFGEKSVVTDLTIRPNI